jgi:hypothetical protein
MFVCYKGRISRSFLYVCMYVFMYLFILPSIFQYYISFVKGINTVREHICRRFASNYYFCAICDEASKESFYYSKI